MPLIVDDLLLIGLGISALATAGVAWWQGEQQAQAATKAGNEIAGATRDAAQIQRDTIKDLTARQDKAIVGATGALKQDRDDAIAAIEDGSADAIADFEKAVNEAVNTYGLSRDDAIRSITSARDQTTNALGQTYGQTRADLAPWQQAGLNALSKLENLEYKKFGIEDFEQDPGYKFRQQQGLEGIEHSALARGGMLSGNTLKAMNEFNSGLASQEYNSAFNRYNTEFANRLNPLQYLANLGYGATGLGVAANQDYGTQMGNIYTRAGENIAGIQGTWGNQVGNALLGRGTTFANIYQNRGSALGNLRQSYGSNIANALLGHAGTVGNIQMTGAQNIGNLGVAGAGAQADALTGAANARASGAVGSTNALSNALSGYLNYSQGNELVNALKGLKKSGSGGVSYPGSSGAA